MQDARVRVRRFRSMGYFAKGLRTLACGPAFATWYNSDSPNRFAEFSTVTKKPLNPIFFPALALGAVANLAVNAADNSKTDTVPANPLGQMVTAAVASTSAGMIVGTIVTHTILEGVYETWLKWPSVMQSGDTSRR